MKTTDIVDAARRRSHDSSSTMIKAIFWDNDGVLVDTERLYFAASRQVLATIGVTLTKEMYVDLFLIQGTGAWHLAEEKGLSRTEIDRLRDKRNALYGKMLLEERIIIDGAAEVLETLCGHFTMGIVTSSRREHFELIHRSSGLLKHFNFILTADDYTKFKPHPQPYLLALEKSGFVGEECLAVEDSERGLRSAKSAGIRCFIVPTELTRSGNFSQADRVLGNIREILAELRGEDKSFLVNAS
jgi:HAD superfamily hydrolase (TIGR01509 family)